MQHGTQFTIVSGPSCADNILWWQIGLGDGRGGFAAEVTENGSYLMALHGADQEGDPASVLPPASPISEEIPPDQSGTGNSASSACPPDSFLGGTDVTWLTETEYQALIQKYVTEEQQILDALMLKTVIVEELADEGWGMFFEWLITSKEISAGIMVGVDFLSGSNLDALADLDAVRGRRSAIEKSGSDPSYRSNNCVAVPITLYFEEPSKSFRYFWTSFLDFPVAIIYNLIDEYRYEQALGGGGGGSW